jgi:sodium/bile acid cotransporter 7
MVAAVLGTSLLRIPKSAEDALSVASHILVFSLFFFQGVRLAPAELRAATRDLRVHSLILGITFVLFPLLCGFIAKLPPLAESPELRVGLLFLGVTPSTIQSSVIFTSLARGNVALAITAASLSSTLGIVVTPLLFSLTRSTNFSTDGLGRGALKVGLELLLPLLLGQLLRRRLLKFTTRRRGLLKALDQSAIVLIVFLAFSHAFAEGLFARYSPQSLALLAALLLTLFFVVFATSVLCCRLLRLPRRDAIAVYFCASKKSLASGAPMARVLFSAPALSATLLPLMLYHQLQLLLCAWLAARLGASDAGQADSVKSEST